jgi:hypothetical protein
MSRDDYDNRFDEPAEDYERPPRRRPGTNGLATAALIMGIVSLCVGPILAIPAIICGILGLTRAGEAGTGKGPAISGLILGGVGLVIIPFISIMLLLPAVRKVREAAARAKDSNDMKVIVLGLHNYNDEKRHLPGPFVTKPDGKVNRGLSWRVAILPYVEQDALHRRFRLDEAWDSAANKPLSQTVVLDYTSTDEMDFQTRYRAFVGPGTAFEDNTLSIPRSFTDGTSNTLLFVETTDKVPWASPQDVTYQPGGALPALGHPGRSTFLAAMADGSVMSLKKNISPAVMHALISRNGNEVLPAGWEK